MPKASAPSMDPSQRRLAWGLLVSLLLHGLLLALHFGVPGLRAGPAAPLTLRLARTAPVPVPDPLPPLPPPLTPPVADAVPPPSTPMPALEATPGPAARGYRLLDPRPAPQQPPQPQPQAPAPDAAVKPRRSPRRRPRAKAAAEGLHAQVIAREAPADSDFKLPPDAKTDPEPAPATDTMAGEDPVPGRVDEAAQQVAEQPDAQAGAQARERQAALRERALEAEREAGRLADEAAALARQRAAAEAETKAQARVRDEEAQRLAEQRRHDEALRAER